MNELVEQFQKTRECPKCANTYFSLEVNWMNTYVKTTYTCDSCNWGFVLMTSCTSDASAPAPSSPNRSVASVPQTQSK